MPSCDPVQGDDTDAQRTATGQSLREQRHPLLWVGPRPRAVGGALRNPSTPDDHSVVHFDVECQWLRAGRIEGTYTFLHHANPHAGESVRDLARGRELDAQADALPRQ